MMCEMMCDGMVMDYGCDDEPVSMAYGKLGLSGS
jgi:hypothetical protein